MITHLRSLTIGGVFIRAVEGKTLPLVLKLIIGSIPYMLYQGFNGELFEYLRWNQYKEGVISSYSITLTDCGFYDI